MYFVGVAGIWTVCKTCCIPTTGVCSLCTPLDPAYLALLFPFFECANTCPTFAHIVQHCYLFVCLPRHCQNRCDSAVQLHARVCTAYAF